jgi:pimeloyl-ACP methyl ester carboxylesterase
MRLGIDLLDDVEWNIGGSLNVEKAVRELQQPLLVIHGEQDESVPVSEAREIIEWSHQSSGELFLVPNQGHTFGIVHPYAGSNTSFDAVLERTETFFREHLA